MDRRVDAFLKEAKIWPKELAKMRSILVTSELTEELKWGQPCYCFNKHNVIIIGELKDSCVFSFFKGSLLKDPKGILEKPGENTQSARVIKFKSVGEITKMESTLKAYIKEAIELEKSGAKVNFKKPDEFKIPEEFKIILDEDSQVNTAFRKLTHGRQRAYLLYFSAPKQSKTRESRIEKYIPQILNGKGLND